DALAERIYLHRHETVDQVMARTVRKIPLLFKHHNIDPSDRQSWQKLAVRLALAHVPGLQVSMRGGRKRTWKAGQGNELVRAFEDMQSRTGMLTKDGSSSYERTSLECGKTLASKISAHATGKQSAPRRSRKLGRHRPEFWSRGASGNCWKIF